jgi:uncharacterized membrane protein (DUF4010 family)
MALSELLYRLALSLGIGLLIGLERGWQTREARPGSRTAGVRTFAITGLLGGIVAAVAQGLDGGNNAGGAVLIGLAFVGYSAVITIFTRAENRATRTYSATTTVAAMLTFALGAYALVGDQRVAAAAAVATAGVLIVREGLHEWVAKITLKELESGLVLLAMTFIALPVLPQMPISWLGNVNAREVWLIAIALASVSFAGYVAVKVLGEERGVLVAAAAGGLVSSTAVMLLNARQAKAGEGSQTILAAGVALATAVSLVRVGVLCIVLQPSLRSLILPSVLTAAMIPTAYSIAVLYKGAHTQGNRPPAEFRNPFGFWSVIGMAVLMGVLIVAGREIYERFGAAGAIAGAGAMGLFDVDAMTVAMTRLVPKSLDATVATYAILTGVASNTFSKMIIGAAIGRGRFAVQVVIVSLACVAAGALALWLTQLAA